MSTISSQNANNAMSVRELRVFEEWGPAPAQVDSPLGMPPQAQGQTHHQASGQTQPRSQACVPTQNHGQTGGQQRKSSLGRSQGYASNSVSTGRVKGNGTALVVPSGQVPQNQAQSRGRGQYQGYSAMNVKTNANEKPTNVALNRPLDLNSSLPRQTLPNQVQGQAAGRHTNAITGVQMQAQSRVRGQNLRQDQRYAPDSFAPGANTSEDLPLQTSQTTHRRYPMGRNKRRNRGPTVFDEWKAQATKYDASNRGRSKHEESERATTAAIHSSSVKLRDIIDEWTVGDANTKTHSGVGDETAISGTHVDVNGIGSSPPKQDSKQTERPEGSKGRSGLRKSSRRNRDRSGSGNNKANEKEPNLDRPCRRERAGPGKKTNKAPMESASFPAAPSADTSTSNTTAFPGETTNALQKTRSHKSCSFSSNGPKLATIGEDNVSTPGPAADEQKQTERESKPDKKESNPSVSTSLEHPEVNQGRDDASRVSCLLQSSLSAAVANPTTTSHTELSASSENPVVSLEQRQYVTATASEVEHDCLSQEEPMPIRSRQRPTEPTSPGKPNHNQLLDIINANLFIFASVE